MPVPERGPYGHQPNSRQPNGRQVRSVRMLAADDSITAKASVAIVGTIVGAR